MCMNELLSILTTRKEKWTTWWGENRSGRCLGGRLEGCKFEGKFQQISNVPCLTWKWLRGKPQHGKYSTESDKLTQVSILENFWNFPSNFPLCFPLARCCEDFSTFLRFSEKRENEKRIKEKFYVFNVLWKIKFSSRIFLQKLLSLGYDFDEKSLKRRDKFKWGKRFISIEKFSACNFPSFSAINSRKSPFPDHTGEKRVRRKRNQVERETCLNADVFTLCKWKLFNCATEATM
jgi:hypothetical protein